MSGPAGCRPGAATRTGGSPRHRSTRRRRWPGASASRRAFRALLASLPPPAKDYGRLVEALRRYREVAARSDWPLVPPGALLRPGDDDARVAAVRARLAAEDEIVSRAATHFDGRLEEAVRRFQARHGLAADGIVGEATVRALNVPASDRIRQIILNLERWRWLPRDLGPRYVTVNAADATLRVVEDDRTVLTSRVVVGDLQHPTPVVQARLDAVVLNPKWNVPTSIAVQEILPRLRENRRYLAEHDIVIMERRESDPFGLAVDWSTISAEAFPFRLQQQPGPDNPLGRIKFDVPNRFDVYLHDTPTRALFARPRRTASHGCIRVERADELAAHVLADGTGAVDARSAWRRPSRVAARCGFRLLGRCPCTYCTGRRSSARTASCSSGTMSTGATTASPPRWPRSGARRGRIWLARSAAVRRPERRHQADRNG